MDGHHYKILRELAKDSTLSQRDLSIKLGMSLGKINYVLNALMGKGFVKVKSFKNSKNKSAYRYILTPSGIKLKMELAYKFLKRKTDEYHTLKIEIEELMQETELVKDEE